MGWDDAPPTAEELSLKPKAIAWDAEPPTKEELAGGPAGPSRLREFAGNVGENALDLINLKKIAQGLGQTAKEGLLDVPKDIAKSSVQLLKTGAKVITGEKQPKDIAQTVMESPIVKRTKAMTEPIAKDPAGFAFKHPLDAASILLAPVAPFLGKGLAARAGTAIEATADVRPGLLRRAAAKTMSTTLGAPEDAILERMKNPTGVKTAFSHTELADQMVNSVNNLKTTVSELDAEAVKNLRSSPFIEDGAIPKTKIKGAIQASRRELGGIFSKEAEAGDYALKNVEKYYKKLRNTVSESQVKDLIQQLDGDIDWSNPAASKTNKALVGVRVRLDGILKKQNPYYAEAMKPVADAVGVLEEMQKKFGIGRKVGEGFHLTDTTVGKIQSALKENRLETQDLLARYKAITGEDLESKIRSANVSSAFNGEKTQGSRRANMGFAVGGAGGFLTGIPPWISSAVGSLAGGFADLYGRRLAGRLADVLSIPEMRRYIPVLQKAAQSGTRVFAATHAKLMEYDPDYTARMTDAIKGGVSGSSRDAKPAPSRK